MIRQLQPEFVVDQDWLIGGLLFAYNVVVLLTIVYVDHERHGWLVDLALVVGVLVNLSGVFLA